MANATSGATAGTQGSGGAREATEALLRLERALESAGAMDTWVARDIAAIRLALGRREGGEHRAAILKLLANDLYGAESNGGEYRPDLRGVEGRLDELIADYQLDAVVDTEDRRRVLEAVRRRAG